MSYCDLEPATFYVVKEVVSRKAHRCCECRGPIRKGELYVNARMGFDGTAETFKQHLVCANACRYARDNMLEDCLPYGGLKDWWYEDGHDAGDKKDPTQAAMRKHFADALRASRRKP